MTPPSAALGNVVHYTSYGTPKGEYTSACRAAIVTEVGDNGVVGLAVFNPTGIFFRTLTEGGCEWHDPGAPTPGSPSCPDPSVHGNPFRYCQCGWIEPSPRGGTWHHYHL